jgi:hypothetical protein
VWITFVLADSQKWGKYVSDEKGFRAAVEISRGIDGLSLTSFIRRRQEFGAYDEQRDVAAFGLAQNACFAI